MYHHARLPLFLTGLLTLLLVLPACSTAERAADTTADAAEEVGEGAVDVAEDAGEAVVDAAGTAWNSVADLFDDDGDADAAALVRPTMAGAAQGTVRFYETG
ncbi:MAG: hypothetical protein R3362_11840, partial [Rhodothermales bacterium]|nr:hypothetical protein [Rhodothermales bacterium]